VQAADFFIRLYLISAAKRRIVGLIIRATDTDRPHGTGPEASGPSWPLSWP